MHRSTRTSTRLTLWLAVKAYFWPSDVSDDNYDDVRSRLLCGFSGVIGVGALLHNLQIHLSATQLPPGASWYSLACAISYFLLPAVWHTTRRVGIGVFLLVAIYYGHSTYMMVVDTSPNWHRETFMLGAPILALLLWGPRLAWSATALASATLVVLASLFDHVPMESALIIIAVTCAIVSGLSLFQREIGKKEARLIELRDRAHAADKGKTDFLANMSHEIRTPLNGLSGILQLLDSADLTKDQAELVATGQLAGRTLLRLINDILDYSKIAANGVTLENIPFEPKEIVQTSVQSQVAAAHAKGLEITWDIDASLPTWIRSDPTRLGQIVTNFLGNAIKFSDVGAISVSLKSAGAFAKISVSDQGIGLTKEAQSRVFNQFEQADTSTTRTYGGTGLGLSISKELVDLLGGDIGVDSAPYRGSTFWFTFPLVPTDAPKNADQTQSMDRSQSLDGVEVLLVEDNLTNQMIAQRFLSSFGVNVVTVDDGRPALKACANKRFDLILMDVQLPDMDGVQATEILRKSKGLNQHTPIVALSANILPEQTTAYMKSGMNACLGKPFRKEALEKLLRALIDPRSRPSQSLDEITPVANPPMRSSPNKR